LHNGNIYKKAKHLYTGVKNVRNCAWKKYRNTEIAIFTTHHSRYNTNDMTHLRRTGTTAGVKVLFTEYTPLKSKLEGTIPSRFELKTKRY
jgi:hypothetical protein